MTLVCRTASPLDDLSQLWPTVGRMKLALDQVLVVVDADQGDRLLGGVLAFDGGHEVVYLGEYTVLATTAHRRVATRLATEALVWAARRGARMIWFHALDPHFIALVQRIGAQAASPAFGFALALPEGLPMT